MLDASMLQRGICSDGTEYYAPIVITQPAQPGGMVPYLEVPELGEVLPTIVQKTSKRLSLLMGDFMRTNIAPLSKSLVANVA